LYQDGKTSSLTALRIQKLESLGIDGITRGTFWEDRLSELADYPQNPRALCSDRYSENIQVGWWVKEEYTGSAERIARHLPNSGLESLDFEWDSLAPSGKSV
jgi:hypothetical protein